jgi:hypothetical protein
MLRKAMNPRFPTVLVPLEDLWPQSRRSLKVTCHPVSPIATSQTRFDVDLP